MYVAHAKGLWMLEGCTREKKHLPQRAGWRWHGPPRCPNTCAGCLAGMPPFRWFTDSEARVFELAHLVATTPGEPRLEFGEESFAARVEQALRERTAQVDWLSSHEEDPR